ncbi:putative uncharacterized protein [Parachlamydia acanthamoebae UV-7]|uniref:Transmembrane protein n=3 Tax=Parachlamydia acanthamoebae TaxID=83552 RepID=F8KVD3_PARAV|nr:hypothetical protein DB43_HO00050 [Parachlamydia acanthamoebae]CCB87657.1 putative uncharacterized protein [Parachlamydia acanthamoebae UV-7]
MILSIDGNSCNAQAYVQSIYFNGISMIKIRTSIDPAFKRKKLLRGTLIAGCGALILFAGMFLPPLQLGKWGLWIFLVGTLLIALGLLPYRRLTLLETTPNELILEQDALYFNQRGHPALMIPLESVEKLTCGKERDQIGLFVSLKRPLPQKVQLLSNRLDNESCQWVGNTSAIFFPHFSRRSCNYLIEEFQEIHSLDEDE